MVEQTNSSAKPQGRARTFSDQVFLKDHEISYEEMKLMEEIMELDEEIKMKAKWMNRRLRRLDELLDRPNQKKLYREFLLRLKSGTEQLSVTYGDNPASSPAKNAESEAIPLRQADVHPDPIVLKQKDVFDAPIALVSQDVAAAETQEEK